MGYAMPTTSKSSSLHQTTPFLPSYFLFSLVGVRSHVIITYCIAHEWGQDCLTTPTTRPERTAEPPTGSLGKHGREDGLRFGGLGDAGITQLLPQMWGLALAERGSKLKENIGPREKCEETRHTEQRRSDYPIMVRRNRTPQSPL